MSESSLAVLGSWSIDPWLAVSLIVVVGFYLRGFRSFYRDRPAQFPMRRCAAFLSGIATILFAIASPIDALADFLLQVHMGQHFLLMMVAPPLIWIGAPVNPVLEGLPRRFLKRSLGPLLASKRLQRIVHTVAHPVSAWLFFVGTTWLWHLPAAYELALRSPFWHDAEHLFFLLSALLFWFPVLSPWPSRPQWPRLAMAPYLALAALQMTAFSALFAFSGQVFYPVYETMPRLWGISALADQAAAGAVMWVPSSIIFLIALSWIMLSALAPAHLVHRPRREGVSLPKRIRASPQAPFDLLGIAWVGGLVASRRFRFYAQCVFFGGALFIIADGFWGPEESFLNLAGVVPWVYWRGWIVLMLLVAGNLFCFACPFTLPRWFARNLLPGRRPVPSILQSKWVGLILLLGFFYAYEAFDLWDSPVWTAWIILGYFVAAFAFDAWFGKPLFCRAVCPIGQFQFLAATVSPLEVSIREVAICEGCEGQECIRGSETSVGCEMDLFLPAKRGNLDCTFCLDCARACPHDNVGIRRHARLHDLTSDRPRAGIGRLAARADLACAALFFCFAAFVNAAGMSAPVMSQQRVLMAAFGIENEALFLALIAIVMLVFLPLGAAELASRTGVVLSSISLNHHERAEFKRRCAFALVPLGFSMWFAHYFFHWITSSQSIFNVFERMSVWANATGMSAGGSMGLAAAMGGLTSMQAGDMGLLSESALPIECIALAVGLWVSLLAAWEIALEAAEMAMPCEDGGEGTQIQHGRGSVSPALGLFLPWGGLLGVLYSVGIWILLQPMEMRGMAM